MGMAGDLEDTESLLKRDFGEIAGSGAEFWEKDGL